MEMVLVRQNNFSTLGHTGGLVNLAPGAEDAKPVIQTLVGFPCLERGRRVKKYSTFFQ